MRGGGDPKVIASILYFAPCALASCVGLVVHPSSPTTQYDSPDVLLNSGT